MEVEGVEGEVEGGGGTCTWKCVNFEILKHVIKWKSSQKLHTLDPSR